MEKTDTFSPQSCLQQFGPTYALGPEAEFSKTNLAVLYVMGAGGERGVCCCPYTVCVFV